MQAQPRRPRRSRQSHHFPFLSLLITDAPQIDMQNAKTGEPLPAVSVFASVPTKTARLVVVDATGELFTEICQRISALAPDRRERDWMVKMAKFLGDVAIEAGGGLESWSRHDQDAVQALLRGWYEAMSKWQQGDGRDELLALTSLVPETGDERDRRELAEADRVKAALEAFEDGGGPFPLEAFCKALKARAQPAAESPVIAGPTMESSDSGATQPAPGQQAPGDAEWPRSWDKWAPRPPRIDSLKDAMEYASGRCEMDTPWGREACDRLRKAAKFMNPVAVHHRPEPEPEPEPEIATLADAMALAAAKLPLDSRAAWAAADRLRSAAAIMSNGDEPEPEIDPDATADLGPAASSRLGYGSVSADPGWRAVEARQRNERDDARREVEMLRQQLDAVAGDLAIAGQTVEARMQRDLDALRSRVALLEALADPSDRQSAVLRACARRVTVGASKTNRGLADRAAAADLPAVDPAAAVPTLTDKQVQALGQAIGHAVALSDVQLQQFRRGLGSSIRDAITTALGRIPGELFGPGGTRPFGLLTNDVRIVVRALRELAARWQPSCERDDVVAPEGWRVTSDSHEAEALGGYAVHAASGFARALPCAEPAAVLSAAGWVLLVRCSGDSDAETDAPREALLAADGGRVATLADVSPVAVAVPKHTGRGCCTTG